MRIDDLDPQPSTDILPVITILAVVFLAAVWGAFLMHVWLSPITN